MRLVSLIPKILLWGLILTGLWGALSVSYSTIMNIDPCPGIFTLPACYLVSTGYLLMLASLIVSSVPLKNRLFYSGWVPTFLIAAAGVGAELIIGNVCPRNENGLPLCNLPFVWRFLFSTN